MQLHDEGVGMQGPHAAEELAIPMSDFMVRLIFRAAFAGLTIWHASPPVTCLRPCLYRTPECHVQVRSDDNQVADGEGLVDVVR
jgi:hypothetical protein